MPKLITLDNIIEWLDNGEQAIKDQVMRTNINDTEGREKLYYLYHAHGLLRSQVLADFADEVTYQHNLYDEPTTEDEKE